MRLELMTRPDMVEEDRPFDGSTPDSGLSGAERSQNDRGRLL